MSGRCTTATWLANVHSPLKQINSGNVATLARAWSYPLGRDSHGRLALGLSFEFTPIVVNGVMYVAASDHVAALEPETGREVWRYLVKGGVPSRRGLAHWPGDATNLPRIVFTSERRLIALTSRAGEPVGSFGTDGVVDMIAPYHSAPTVYKNLLILGTNGLPGGVRAFDARSGAKVWDFNSVAQPGDPASKTWEADSWRNRSGTYSWAFSQTLDADAGFSMSPSRRRVRTTTGAVIGSATISTATRWLPSRPTLAS